MINEFNDIVFMSYLLKRNKSGIKRSNERSDITFRTCWNLLFATL